MRAAVCFNLHKSVSRGYLDLWAHFTLDKKKPQSALCLRYEAFVPPLDLDKVMDHHYTAPTGIIPVSDVRGCP